MQRKKPDANKLCQAFFAEFGAGDESRTRDLNLGKVALYQLSYSRLGTFYRKKMLFRAKTKTIS